VRSQASLPPDATIALIKAKNKLKEPNIDLKKPGGLLRRFLNDRGNSPLEGPPLPDPAQGCGYFETDVGLARPGDPKGERGSRRLVFEVNESSKQILEIYFTEEHYGKFTFERVV
jgi:hypothetical protein